MLGLHYGHSKGTGRMKVGGMMECFRDPLTKTLRPTRRARSP